MLKLRLRYIAAAGALMLSAASISLPAFSHQNDGQCNSGGGGKPMGMMNQMPMGGGGHMGMMDQMPMGCGGHMGMMDQMPMGGGGHMGMMDQMPMMGGGHMGMMDQTPMMGGGHMGMMGKYEALGLSKEQKEQMNDIQHQLQKQHWAIMGEMIDLHAALREAHASDRPDPKTVGAVYGKIFDLKRRMIEAKIDAKNKKKDVLTEEQLAQMKKMKHKRGGMMQGQGGMMKGQGGMMQGQGGTMQQGG